MARLGSSAVKYLGRVAPTLSPFFETSEVKNESSDALLMSQIKSVTELDTKILTSKVDFLLEKFQIPEFETFPRENRLLRSKFSYPALSRSLFGT